MARHCEGPWFRACKGTWFATFNERKVSLKVRGIENKAEAAKARHRLMADGLPELPKPEPPKEVPKPKDEMTVKELFDDRKAASMKALEVLRRLNIVLGLADREVVKLRGRLTFGQVVSIADRSLIRRTDGFFQQVFC